MELCAELQLGGLTPSEELMRVTRGQVRVPIFAMIRPRAGNFLYSAQEIAQMRHDIGLAKRLGMDGVVLGVLTKGGRVDIERTKELVKLARPLPLTFHRAFDHIAELDAALEDVIAAGATRILTSGGAPSAPAGMATLGRLVGKAKDRIIIVPGGGINADSVLQVAKGSGARELHSGLGSVLPYGQQDYNLFESEVRKLSERLANLV